MTLEEILEYLFPRYPARPDRRGEHTGGYNAEGDGDLLERYIEKVSGPTPAATSITMPKQKRNHSAPFLFGSGRPVVEAERPCACNLRKKL